jgi:hypothetical protein
MLILKWFIEFIGVSNVRITSCFVVHLIVVGYEF